MPLRGPNPEDERKLHTEINQIGNQRFILTTLALTLFGVLTTLMIPKEAPQIGSSINVFPFTISVVLSLLLFGVYLWSHLLKNTMRILTSYLVETKKSSWELDWREFRRDSYYAHTKPQTFIFLLINVIGIAFPFLLSWIYSLNIPFVVVPIAAVIVGIVTELLIYLMGFHNLFDDEAKTEKRWQMLNK